MQTVSKQNKRMDDFYLKIKIHIECDEEEQFRSPVTSEKVKSMLQNEKNCYVTFRWPRRRS